MIRASDQVPANSISYDSLLWTPDLTITPLNIFDGSFDPNQTFVETYGNLLTDKEALFTDGSKKKDSWLLV